jgi:hypothetical protein
MLESKIYTLSEKHRRTPSRRLLQDTREKNHIPPVCLSPKGPRRQKIANHAIAPTLKRKRNVKKEVPEPKANNQQNLPPTSASVSVPLLFLLSIFGHVVEPS